MSTNPLLSSAISEQVPGFLRVDHPVFVSFLEAYYEYLESDNPKTATSFEDIKDVDKSLDIFIQNFKNEFLKDFPESLVVDPVTNRPVEQRKLIKNINSFYRSKGTPNAIKFLIRVLLDSNADIYEPSSDMFRISDGKYIVDKTIRTTSTQGQKLFSSIGKEIQQLADDNAMTAYVENFVGQMYAEGFFSGNSAAVQAAYGAEGVTEFVTAAIGTYGLAQNADGYVPNADAAPVADFKIFG